MPVITTPEGKDVWVQPGSPDALKWEAQQASTSQTSQPTTSYWDGATGRMVEEPNPSYQAPSQAQTAFKPIADNSPKGFAASHPWLSGFGRFVKETAKDTARSFVEAGTNVASVAEATGSLVGRAMSGDDSETFGKAGVKAQEALVSGYKVPGFGQVKPAALSGVGNALTLGADKAHMDETRPESEILRVLGIGTQIGTTLAPGAQGLGAGARYGTAAAKGAAFALGRVLDKQGAAQEKQNTISFGSQAAEDVTAVGLGGIAGILAQGATDIAGAVTRYGVRKVGDAMWKRTVEGQMKGLPGVTKADIELLKENKAIGQVFFKSLAQAQDEGGQQVGEEEVRRLLLESARTTIRQAEEKVGGAYEKGFAAVQKKFPDAVADKTRLQTQLTGVADKVAETADPAAEPAVDKAIKIVNGNKDWSLTGLRLLKNKLWDFADQLEEKSPARSLAMEFWGTIDDEMDTLTDGAMGKVNAPYAAFKRAMWQVTPLWSRKVKDDAALNFVAGLSGASRTGSASAFRAIESAAGLQEGALDNLLNVSRVVRKLVAPEVATGGRVPDIWRALGGMGIGSSVGAAIGTGAGAVIGMPAAGAAVGSAAGGAIAARTLAKTITPRALADAFFAGMPEQTSAAWRQALAKVMESEPARIAIISSLLTLAGVRPK